MRRGNRKAMFVYVVTAGKSGYVSGPGAQALIKAAGGRGVWSRQRRAWATSAQVADRVVEICDERGLPVAFQREVSA